MHILNKRSYIIYYLRVLQKLIDIRYYLSFLIDSDFVQELSFLWVNGTVKVVITVAGPHSHPYIT